MKLNKLFNVLVATGAASTVGLAGCGSDSSSSGTAGAAGSGTAGAAGSGTAGSGTAGSGTAGTAGSGTAGSGTAGTAGSCALTTCQTWTIVNGCCCWLPAGFTSTLCGSAPGCPDTETCCIGHDGR